MAIGYLSNFRKQKLRKLCNTLYMRSIHDNIIPEQRKKEKKKTVLLGYYISRNRSFNNKTRTIATYATITQMTTTTAASLETDATLKTGLKGLGLNGPNSQVLMDQGILRLKGLADFGADELDGCMRALSRQFTTQESGSTKDDRLFIPFTVLKKLKALFA